MERHGLETCRAALVGFGWTGGGPASRKKCLDSFLLWPIILYRLDQGSRRVGEVFRRAAGTARLASGLVCRVHKAPRRLSSPQPRAAILIAHRACWLPRGLQTR
jgi:hypothetical protein